MTVKLFIAGTDTGIGKTYVSVKILELCAEAGLTTLGIKPIASGCTIQNGQLINSDALSLQQVSTLKLRYEQHNPFSFAPPIAPNIAALQTHTLLHVKPLLTHLNNAALHAPDLLLVEGVGGWHVPLNSQESMADYVEQAKLKVILVVGLRLGCLNHAILTHLAMQKRGIDVIGWIGNVCEPNVAVLESLIATLKEWLPIPYLTFIPYKKETSIETSVLTHILQGCREMI